MDHVLFALAASLAGCSLAVSTDGLSGGTDGIAASSGDSEGSGSGSASGSGSGSDDDSDDDRSGRSGSPTPPTIPSTSGPQGACAGQQLDGHCYFLIGDGNFEQSRAACAAQGAHLVTITSAVEQNLVSAMVTGSIWIGLQAKVASNDRAAFDWITGEAKTVDFWYSGQPNDGTGYVVMHHSNRQWRDVPPTNTYPAVCERE